MPERCCNAFTSDSLIGVRPDVHYYCNNAHHSGQVRPPWADPTAISVRTRLSILLYDHYRMRQMPITGVHRFKIEMLSAREQPRV